MSRRDGLPQSVFEAQSKAEEIDDRIDAGGDWRSDDDFQLERGVPGRMKLQTVKPPCPICRRNTYRHNGRCVDCTERKAEERKLGLHHYGLSLDDYARLAEEAGGHCVICRRRPTGERLSKLVIDHDHKTGQVRGLICGGCNNGLGFFRDNPAALEAAAQYVREHSSSD